MKARMNSPVMVIPEALQALMAVGKAAKKGGLPPQMAMLVHLRASQINGAGPTDRKASAQRHWSEVDTRHLSSLPSVIEG